MLLLPDAVLHPEPWPLVTSARALGPEACAHLRALFERDVPWERHEGGFYACHVAVVTDLVDAGLLRSLPARLGELLDVPLVDRVKVTIQRMDPGDHALRHTDRPLLGYEAARLIVHLNPGWTEADGGRFEAYADEDGPAAHALLPEHDHGVAFAMTPATHHAVLPARRMRRTVVLNAWHAGNTAEVSAFVRDLFEGVRFDALPAALDPWMAEAEARLDEEVTRRAALVALALARWGYDDGVVVCAYRRALAEDWNAAPVTEGDGEEAVAGALAAWLVRLWLDGFDARWWAATARDLAARVPARWRRLEAPWATCFPISPRGSRG